MSTKIAISVFLLLASAGIIVGTFRQMRRVTRMDEYIQVTESNIILNTRYRYASVDPDPVITQTLALNQFNSNILGVYGRSGEPIQYVNSSNRLFVIFDEPILSGDMVEYTVQTELGANYPYFNIVDHNSNKFTLHYISMDSSPAVKTKQFILPENAQILQVSSSREGIEMNSHRVRVNDRMNDSDRFDISIEFALYNCTVKHVKATPPVIDGNSNVVIRASKELYSAPPTLRGDFTGWVEVQMVDDGEFYIFVTNLEEGRYYYQFRYMALPSSDDSCDDRQIIVGGESASVMTVDY